MDNELAIKKSFKIIKKKQKKTEGCFLKTQIYISKIIKKKYCKKKHLKTRKKST